MRRSALVVIAFNGTYKQMLHVPMNGNRLLVDPLATATNTDYGESCYDNFFRCTVHLIVSLTPILEYWDQEENISEVIV